MAAAEPLYDEIGIGYDDSRCADTRITDALWRHLRPRPGARYLDLACGTGNYTSALADRGADIVGLDISPTMLEQARAKNPGGAWVLGDARILPFPDGTFAGAVCTVAIHHFDELCRPFAELRRVLRGGRFVIFTSTPEQTASFWLSHYFPDAIRRSSRKMPPLGDVLGALQEAGFTVPDCEPWHVPKDLEDGFLYCGKYRPHLYLDAAFRRGISTFASLAESSEVAAGVEALRRDIESGAVWDHIEASNHDGGDYMFVTADCGDGADG